MYIIYMEWRNSIFFLDYYKLYVSIFFNIVP